MQIYITKKETENDAVLQVIKYLKAIQDIIIKNVHY